MFKKFLPHPHLVDNQAEIWMSGIGLFSANRASLSDFIGDVLEGMTSKGTEIKKKRPQ